MMMTCRPIPTRVRPATPSRWHGDEPVSDAKAFVKAKTPIATVRSELARRAADATDALAVDGTAKPAGAAETAVAAAWDSVVQEINSKMPANARR